MVCDSLLSFVIKHNLKLIKDMYGIKTVNETLNK